MTRAYKVTAFTLLVTAVLGSIAYSVYLTLIVGVTGGPDIISAISSGKLSAKSISSIEVVEPMIGYMPFTTEEYSKLRRREIIDSPDTISQMLSLLAASQPGRIHQNHPVTSNVAYVKINTGNDFFWFYCQVLEDCDGSVFNLSANTRNATNPNGASTYHLADFSELLAILNGEKTNLLNRP